MDNKNLPTEEAEVDQSYPSYALPEILDLRAASPLASDLAARRGETIVLNASGVRRLGGQCLQVLLSAKTCWAKDGVAFHIVKSSEEFTDALSLLGAQSLLSSSQA